MTPFVLNLDSNKLCSTYSGYNGKIVVILSQIYWYIILWAINTITCGLQQISTHATIYGMYCVNHRCVYTSPIWTSISLHSFFNFVSACLILTTGPVARGERGRERERGRNIRKEEGSKTKRSYTSICHA